MIRSEVLVVGGGLAGAAAALRLARAGRQVRLVEREPGGHDKVCGEFLGPGAQKELRALGLDPLELGALPIGKIRLCSAHGVAEADLPFPALALSRRSLDEALLRRAAHEGAEILRGRRVAGLTREPDHWTARLGEDRLEASEVLLATGKHDLRGHPRPQGIHDGLVGFKLQFAPGTAAKAAIAGAVELFLFEGGYAGLQLIAPDRATLCAVVERRRLDRVGGSWGGLVAALLDELPLLACRLSGVDLAGRRPAAVAAIPYGAMSRDADGPWRLGDQAAVVPSFTGEGMALALSSARLASELLMGGCTPRTYHSLLARRVGNRLLVTSLLSRILTRSLPQRGILTLTRRHPRLLAVAASTTRFDFFQRVDYHHE
jgi:flavin-dependent dehydrogenase